MECHSSRKLYYCILCLFAIMQKGEAEECKFEPPCRCVSRNFEIDLSSRSMHLPLVAVDDKKDFTYYVNPCNKPLTSISQCYSYNASLVACQVQGSSVYGLGTLNDNNMAGDPEKGTVILTNSFTKLGGDKRVLNVTLKCASVEGNLMFFKDSGSEKPYTYYFSLETKYACKSSPSSGDRISAGSVMVIIFFVLVVVYIVGGVLFLKFVRKAEGAETIPNYEFWKDFPSLVKDGVRFTFKGCKAESTYEKI